MHTNPVEQTQGPAPFLQMGRIDIPAMVEEEFNDWYNTAYIPPYLRLPGLSRRASLRRGRRPAEIPDALRIRACRRARKRAEWDKARDSNPWSNRIRAFMRHDVGSPGVYRRLCPK